MLLYPRLCAVLVLVNGGAQAFIATHPKKFNEWYPYYGGVLQELSSGNIAPGTAVPNANCSAQMAAYRASKGGQGYNVTLGSCYNGESESAVFSEQELA